MVDVGNKEDTLRVATASGRVTVGPAAFKLMAENRMKKGDVLTVAQLAGIMGAKQTSQLIPLCHSISLNQVSVKLMLDRDGLSINIWARARTFGKTGVEMEALTAVSVAALTVYDMCKAVTKDISIGYIRLRDKSGGASGDYVWRGTHD